MFSFDYSSFLHKSTTYTVFRVLIFAFALRFVSRETIFALQFLSCVTTVLKMPNLWRIQIMPTCYKSKHKFCYVFSFICKTALRQPIKPIQRGQSIHIHNFYCSRRTDSDYRKLDFTLLKQKPDIK